jgi:hypothetical protein
MVGLRGPHLQCEGAVRVQLGLLQDPRRSNRWRTCAK